MTFLNPAFLWAAFAISIPIIVHLFNFRRPKKVLFSNTEIVKEVRKSVVRRVRLKQLLILAARCLAILALVFLFAEPVIVADDAAAFEGGRNSVVIVVDNSYSMKAGSEKGDYFHQAQQFANEVVKNHAKEDEFLVMTTGDLRLNYNFATKEDVLEEIKDMKVRQNITTWSDVLQLAPELFSKANYNKTLYFISDFQESTVMGDSVVDYDKESGIRVNMVPLATREQRNVYVEDHGLETRIIQAGSPVTLSMSLINDGREDLNDLKIQVMLEGTPEATSTDTVPAGQKLVKKISLIPPKAGWNSGYIEIDDYPVEYDNRRYFSFYVPENERVLVVEGEQSDPVRIVYSDLLKQFRPDFISYKDFAQARIEEYQFVVLLGINEISSGLEEQLDYHLKAGKSILFFPGADINRDEINRFLTAQNVGSFGEFVESETGLVADQVDLQHPVFADVFKRNSTNGKVDPARVYKYYRFTSANEVEQNPVMRFSNGDPLLLESRPGDGQIFLFTVFPSDSWTDLQYKAIFAPLMLRLSLLMNHSQKVEQNQDLGSFHVKRVKTQNQSQIKLVRADGTEIMPLQEPREGFMVLRFDRLETDNVAEVIEGNYELRQGEDLLEEISFNIPDAESQLKSFTQEEVADRFASLGFESVNVIAGDPKNVASEIQFQSTGYPLWKYFLFAALLFLLIEVLLLQMKESA